MHIFFLHSVSFEQYLRKLRYYYNIVCPFLCVHFYTISKCPGITAGFLQIQFSKLNMHVELNLTVYAYFALHNECILTTITTSFITKFKKKLNLTI